VDLRRWLWYARNLYRSQRRLLPRHLHSRLRRRGGHRRIFVWQYSDIRTHLVARVGGSLLHSYFE